MNVSFNNTPRVVEVAMDISKNIVEESVITDSITPSSGLLTLTGGLKTTGAVTSNQLISINDIINVDGNLIASKGLAASEAVTINSNDLDNTSTLHMHGSNKAHPDVSIVCQNGMSGADNILVF